MASGTSERGDIARERLVARRGAPVVLLLDGDARFNNGSAQAESLWQAFEGAIRTLIAVNRAALELGESVSTILPDGSHSLQIAPLVRHNGFVLLLEPFSERDPMRDLYERYALTPREREVARLLVAGANTGEIAAALSIAPSTAIIHVKSILAKTGAKTRAAAVGRMIQHDGGNVRK